MSELGWKSLGVLELTALPSIDQERWLSWVRETDVLLVNGGDALYLCHWMRQSGLADLLPTLPEKVWVGLSAGSMVMTPRIGEDFVGWKPPGGGDERAGRRRLLDLPARGSRGAAGQLHGQRGGWAADLGPRRTRSTTRPRSRWSTAPSRSSPRGTGSFSPRRPDDGQHAGRRPHPGQPAIGRGEGDRAHGRPARRRDRRRVGGTHRSPPARVWLGEVEGDLRPGGEFRARFFASGWEGTGRIEVCEPPRRLLVLTTDADDPHDHAIEAALTADGDRRSWPGRSGACRSTSSPPTGRRSRSTSRPCRLPGRSRPLRCGRPVRRAVAALSGVGHGIAQMRDAHTGDDLRIPEHGPRVREVVEQARTPPPSSTAARSTWSSSSSPAFRHCWIVRAPCTPTDLARQPLSPGRRRSRCRRSRTRPSSRAAASRRAPGG